MLLFKIENTVKKQILFLSITAILFNACSTDLDVKGDWKETMVVYGLLDQSKPKQYIKINKAFLGEGNALSFAQVKDSVQFVNALTVILEKVSTGDTFQFKPTSTIPKDGGTFYGPNQTNAIYSGNSTNLFGATLTTNSTYKLTIKNSETGTEVKATTKLVSDFGNFSLPTPSTSNFSLIIANNNGYKFRVTWPSAANAKLYQLIMRFNYIDSTTSGNVNQYIDKIFPETKTQTLAGGEVIEYSIVGQDYLQYIASQIDNYSGLWQRKPGNIELFAIAAGEELSTFIDVNKPSTGIVQEKPEYTNITNGLGIFSARYYKAAFSKPMSKSTIDSLSRGFRTCHLKFSNGLGVWPGCQ